MLFSNLQTYGKDKCTPAFCNAGKYKNVTGFYRGCPRSGDIPNVVSMSAGTAGFRREYLEFFLSFAHHYFLVQMKIDCITRYWIIWGGGVVPVSSLCSLPPHFFLLFHYHPSLRGAKKCMIAFWPWLYWNLGCCMLLSGWKQCFNLQ